MPKLMKLLGIGSRRASSVCGPSIQGLFPLDGSSSQPITLTQKIYNTKYRLHQWCPSQSWLEDDIFRDPRNGTKGTKCTFMWMNSIPTWQSPTFCKCTPVTLETKTAGFLCMCVCILFMKSIQSQIHSRMEGWQEIMHVPSNFPASYWQLELWK